MRMSRLACIAAVASSLVLPSVGHAQLVRSATGANPAGIQASVDQFRIDLGPLNPNVAGSLGSGRREINWDGVPNMFAAPNTLPANFFNVTSPRGVVFSTPGTGLQVSGTPGVAPVEFENIDPTYPGTFGVFSPPRLFTALGSNLVDVSFFVPGSTTAALSRGFGAVFTDVDLPNVTSLSFFDATNASLGTFFAPGIAGNETLSFLGVSFADPVVSRVRIVSGAGALGGGVLDSMVDLAVIDDVVFGEPIGPAAVPEPATLVLVAAGVAGFGVMTRRRSRRSTSGGACVTIRAPRRTAMRDRLAGTALLLALVTAGCSTVPKDQAVAEALMWDAARECKGRYGTIQSVDRIDHYGRLHFSYHGSGHENNAFMQCYRDGVEDKLRNAANIPKERVTREPDSPPRVTVPAEASGGVALIMVRLNGTTDARMIVDTGAAWTILSPSIVSKLGLTIPINTHHSIAQVAGGREITMPRIRLASARVASVAVENLYVGVYDAFPQAPQVQGVLGVDFLRHFRVSIDPGGKRLTLDTPD